MRLIKNTFPTTSALVASLAVAGTLFTATSALAEEDGFPGEFTGYATLASEYIFRGVSLSDDEPAIQGSIDYALGGFHAGVWGTSGEFGDGNIELDYTVGYGGEIDAYSMMLRLFITPIRVTVVTATISRLWEPLAATLVLFQLLLEWVYAGRTGCLCR